MFSHFMFLTAYNLPHYLISKGVITAESLVNADFVLTEVGRRNRNFKIIRRRQPGLFVKQVKSTEAQAIATLHREALLYRAVGSNPAYVGATMVPKFVDYDERRRVLIVNLAENSESLAERHFREGTYREDSAKLLGEGMARIHTWGTTMAADSSLRPLFTYQPPWPLLLDQTGYSFLETVAPVGKALAASLQQLPALQYLLGTLRGGWHYDSLVHGDMKWDNCIIESRPDQKPQLIIVDWELADIGDGAWDVAAIIKEYVTAVLLNAYNRQMVAAQGGAPDAPLTFEDVQPSVRAFWRSYISTRQLSEPSVYLDRAIRLTGARLVIGVLEYLFNSHEIGPLGNMMLQAAVNILTAPSVARVQIFGTEGHA